MLLWLVPLLLGAGSLLLIPWWSERGLRTAERQLDAGDAEAALQSVEGYLQTQGTSDAALALKARVLVKLGQAAEALRLIDRVGAASVPEMRAYSEASLMLQRWMSALPVLEHLVKLLPEDADLLHELSACRARLGRYEEAIDAAQRFAKLPGCEARGYTLIGLLERRLDMIVYRAKFAPTIFIHGTKDTTVPMSSSVDFFNKLNEAGVPSALTLIQGAAHAFDNTALDAVEVMAHSIDLFLDRLIVNPQPYASFGGGGGGARGGAPGGARGGGRGAGGGGQRMRARQRAAASGQAAPGEIAHRGRFP